MQKSRWTTIVAMIASLVLAGYARRWASNARQTAAANPFLPLGTAGEGPEASDANLANMNSYSLGLLLGGMRGPLVMFLWSTSEAQKSQHDLEDFNTKIEWIRLLQPEFDTVHLYQIWNKAYNVSVQMANLPEKYSAVLDAIDYADSIDGQRPDDINIVFCIASVYGNKLGESHESAYYTRRMRQETMVPKRQTLVTMPDAKLQDFMAAARSVGMDQPNASAEANDTSQTVTLKIDGTIADLLRPKLTSADFVFRDLPAPKPPSQGNVQRDRMDTVLDSNGNVLPQYLTPVHPRPSNWPAEYSWYDGSKLQFLADYQPFPYGLPPEAFAYNYYKRAQQLQTVAHEDTLQTSNFVVDSRPALELKFWAAREAEEGRRAEMRLIGLDDTGERMTLESAVFASDPDHVPSSPPTAYADPAAAPRALAAYARAAKVYMDSGIEIQAHLRRFPQNHDTFMSHVDDDIAYSMLYQADHDFLAGLLDPSLRDKSWASSAAGFSSAEHEIALIILKYYVHDEVAEKIFPTDPATRKPRTRQTIDQIPADQCIALLDNVLKAESDVNKSRGDEYASDRNDYMKYIHHCQGRLKFMGK